MPEKYYGRCDTGWIRIVVPGQITSLPVNIVHIILFIVRSLRAFG